MANQLWAQAQLSFVADGTSTTLLLNFMRAPLDFPNNSFGGVLALPKTVTATGPDALGPITATLDALGNLLLTFTAGAPAAGLYHGISLTLLFA